jgi:DNA-binding CsgD family transcriptional regulator/PAS domain-containing protein
MRGDLLRLIYAGVLESRPWLSFLREFRRALGCTHANLAFYRAAGISPDSVADADYDMEHTFAAYWNTYASLDPTPYRTLSPGRVYSKQELWQADHVFYREFLLPRGIREAALLPIAEPGGMRAWLTFARPEGAFSASECEAIRSLTPHFSAALEIFATLKSAQLERDIYKEAVESAAIGTILLDEQGHALRVDAIAARILERNPAIAITRGRLSTKNRSVDTALQEAIATATTSTTGQLFSRALRLEDDGQLSLLVRSIAPGSMPAHEKGATAVVYLTDSKYASTTTVQRLIDLFKLSATEAALALQLARGRTLAEAAVALNLSEQTARTYSKQIFSKTGTHRQAELVRLILTSVAHVGSHSETYR